MLKKIINNYQKPLCLAFVLLLGGCVTTSTHEQSWEAKLVSELPVLGHRNWIVIADSAYPKQSASGIETIYTDAKQIDVLKKVLSAVNDAPHVRAQVLIDSEMSLVPESDAPGIDQYREQLSLLLKGEEVETMPHDDIIKQLDVDARVFNILLLKTDMTIPYTSVFLKLDAGYWDAEKEQRLRKLLK